MGRYKGRVLEYLVVNEPQHSDSSRNELQPNVWLTRIGPKYIRLAFGHARQIDPDAYLILNEWGAGFLQQEYGPTGRPPRY